MVIIFLSCLHGSELAYRCAKSDYEGNFDLDDCTEYTDMSEQLWDLESDLESLQDELESLESDDE